MQRDKKGGVQYWMGIIAVRGFLVNLVAWFVVTSVLGGTAAKTDGGHYYLAGGSKVNLVYTQVSGRVYHFVQLWDWLTLAWGIVFFVYLLRALSKARPMTLTEKYLQRRDF